MTEHTNIICVHMCMRKMLACYVYTCGSMQRYNIDIPYFNFLGLYPLLTSTADLIVSTWSCGRICITNTSYVCFKQYFGLSQAWHSFLWRLHDKYIGVLEFQFCNNPLYIHTTHDATYCIYPPIYTITIQPPYIILQMHLAPVASVERQS